MNRLSLVANRTISSIKGGGLLAIAVLLLGCFVAPHKALAACAAPAADYGTATTTTSISSNGTYRIWSRIMAPDASSNSYLLEVDGGNCYVVGDSAISPNAWTWVDYQNGSSGSKIDVALNAGQHTLKMIGREAGVKLDRVLLVSDLACVPTGAGANCATAGDTTPPLVAVSAPASNATVSGTVNITANVTDNTGVSKVEFYVNGSLKATDTAAPYSYGWDSKTVANNTYTLMAKAYDAAGNSASDSLQVAVKNNDTQAPTAPSALTANAAASNKIDLAWTASTDTVGVSGYWITRNGVTIDQVGAVTSYSDTSVSPNTTYTYKITAYDAAGNNSPASAAASATTPKAPDTQVPTAPTNLVAAVVSTSQINLSWTASTDNVGVGSYDVYRATGTAAASKISTVTGTSFGDADLRAATQYSYYVLAQDGSGNASKPSATVNATTQSNPPVPKPTTGEIKGKVKDERNKQALAGAQITLRGDGSRKIYTASSTGEYDITGLQPGNYTLKYQKRGYSSQIVTVKVRSDRAVTRNITLQPRR